MKKSVIISVAILIAMSLNSCGVTATSFNGSSETKLVLKEKNFHVVGQAYGEAKAVYVLGIGGLSKKALRANAIDELSRNVKLTGSQALANITIHTSVKMITPLYIEVVCDATANVIEFD